MNVINVGRGVLFFPVSNNIRDILSPHVVRWILKVAVQAVIAADLKHRAGGVRILDMVRLALYILRELCDIPPLPLLLYESSGDRGWSREIEDEEYGQYTRDCPF